METIKCSSPITLKRKADEPPCFEEGKRSKLEPTSPTPEPPVEFESVNNNYKTADDDGEEAEGESFGSDSEPPEPVERSAENMATMRDEMFQRYQPWLLGAYGDLKKTKTITLKKYDRIVRTLRGLIPNMAENSKFRFWIRTKGFCLGPPDTSGKQELYVACPRVAARVQAQYTGALTSARQECQSFAHDWHGTPVPGAQNLLGSLSRYDKSENAQAVYQALISPLQATSIFTLALPLPMARSRLPLII
ncbi:hypothetical protein J6590_043788 [Homalodisca vitripennis]|nr:hypothetical protein J6590_043788 [Homalodisca vitripennis]